MLNKNVMFVKKIIIKKFCILRILNICKRTIYVGSRISFSNF